jgi:ubiquinone/menaquinone biosynthesis C-methylase UbiE
MPKTITKKPAATKPETKKSKSRVKAPKNSESGDGYLHGFTPTEQNRLYHQARFLEDHVFAHVDFSGRKSIVEIGSGVGAQTEILRERFPKLKISCLDASKEQITRAQKHLAKDIKQGSVSLTLGNASNMPFPDDQFDGAFVTWFLEHVSDPVGILKEARRVMRRDAVIYVNEVLNHSFFVHPYSPATQQYWFAFNDHQWSLKGDPYVGAKLGNYLMAAGFANITTSFSYWHLDNRQPKLRGRFIEYWIDLLLSGAPELEKAGKVTKTLVKQMTEELSSLRHNPDSVMFMGFMKAKATVL